MIKTVIDVDKAIDHYNEQNPKLKQLNRQDLSTQINTSPQIFSDWKNKSTPKVVQRLAEISKITGCPLDKFISNGD